MKKSDLQNYPNDVYNNSRPWTIPKNRFDYLDKCLQEEKHFKYESNGTEYVNLLAQDIDIIQRWIHRVAQYQNEECKATCNIIHELNQSFTAYGSCEFIQEDTVKIEISIGIILAIDDLMHSVVSKGDILCFDSDFHYNPKNGSIPMVYSESFPKVRFSDYHPIRKLSPSDLNSMGRIASDYGLFYYVFPKDPIRLRLARFLSHVACTWVYFHEHAHYLEGHCHFNRASDDNEFSLWIVGLSGQERINHINKSLEWQADTLATILTLDQFFHPNWLDYVPEYVSQEKSKQWLVRILGVAICLVCLIFRKREEIYGRSNSYPLARTRLITVLVTIAKYFQIRVVNSPIYMYPHEYLNAIIGVLTDISGASRILKALPGENDINNNKRVSNSINFLDDSQVLYKIFDWLNKEVYGKRNIITDENIEIFKKYVSEYFDLEYYNDVERRHAKFIKFRLQATQPKTVYGE